MNTNSFYDIYLQIMSPNPPHDLADTWYSLIGDFLYLKSLLLDKMFLQHPQHGNSKFNRHTNNLRQMYPCISCLKSLIAAYKLCISHYSDYFW